MIFYMLPAKYAKYKIRELYRIPRFQARKYTEYLGII